MIGNTVLSVVQRFVSERKCICQCGCGNEIVYKPHHKYYNPRFITGHNRTRGHTGHKHTEESRKKMSEHSTKWKGDNVGYRALHQWVRKYLPSPEKCQMCNEIKRLTLANITGEYNRSFCNWLYLCYKCHNRIDR